MRELDINKKWKLIVEDEQISAERLPKELFRAHNSLYSRMIKRGLGLTAAAIFAVLLIPLYILISIFIIAESGFPVFYRADRGGYRNHVFKIYKFRTMVQNADKIGGGTTALNDSRITGVGRILRKTKLDELPQLFNIIKGEMAFVGPRPELLKYTSRYKGAERLILQVRPGITDYSSVEFINLDEIVGETNADEAYEQVVLKKKNKLRLKYVGMISFQTDCRLFYRTVKSVLRKIVYGK